MKLLVFVLAATAQAINTVQCGDELTEQQRDHCKVGNTFLSTTDMEHHFNIFSEYTFKLGAPNV